MTKRYKVEVRIKKEVHDPQGKALENVLKDLGFSGVSGIRVGKLIEFDLEGDDKTKIEKMAKEVFSNPVIEEYRVLES
jgi:phosphoribosylformylglycinamidine synthase subunit PurS